MIKIKTRLVSSYEEFEALEHDWNRLYEQSDAITIFSSWDWLITWWEVFSNVSKRELFIICSYADDELIGIAPFQIERSYPLSLLQGRTLRFIGSSAKNEIMTEFSDLIVKQGFEDECIKSVADCLLEYKKRWEYADFEFLQKDALILKCFNNPVEKIHTQKIQYGVRYVIPKLASAEEYQALLPSRWSKAFIRKKRAIERDGGYVVEGVSDTSEINYGFDCLSNLHRERWEEKLGSCIFDNQKFNEFHLKVLNRLVPKGKADIKSLIHNDEALASIYTFTDKGQVHYYQSGFSTLYGNKYTPLFLLICNEIGIASENGAIFDFMFDDNLNSYKKNQYCASGEEMYRLKLSFSPHRFVAHSLAKKSVNALRNLKQYYSKKLASSPN